MCMFHVLYYSSLEGGWGGIWALNVKAHQADMTDWMEEVGTSPEALSALSANT